MLDDLGRTTAEVIFDRIVAEARASLAKGNVRAKSTLETMNRLKEICDEILSGAAIAVADEKKKDRTPFRSKRINEKSIHAYNDLKGWIGPHPVTIRKHDGYNSYVEARVQEVPIKKKARSSTNQRELDSIVDKLGSIEDRDVLRRHLEMGREAKAKLDIMLNTVTKLPGIDLDALKGSGKLEFASAGVDEATRKVITKLLRRMTDNDGFLRNFDLIFRAGRLKMDYGTGQDLIFPEEIEALSRLAWFELPPDENKTAD